jgi:hypothetical protein
MQIFSLHGSTYIATRNEKINSCQNSDYYSEKVRCSFCHGLLSLVFRLQCIKKFLKYVKNILLNTLNQDSTNCLLRIDFTTHTDLVAICTKFKYNGQRIRKFNQNIKIKPHLSRQSSGIEAGFLILYGSSR